MRVLADMIADRCEAASCVCSDKNTVFVAAMSSSTSMGCNQPLRSNLFALWLEVVTGDSVGRVRTPGVSSASSIDSSSNVVHRDENRLDGDSGVRERASIPRVCCLGVSGFVFALKAPEFCSNIAHNERKQSTPTMYE